MKRCRYCLVFVIVLAGQLSASGIRKPAVEGQFYPADGKELVRVVDRYLSSVPENDVSGEPVALLVPHAGYVYSGQTAAYAYAALKKRINIKTVVLIGNSHHFPLGRGAVYAKGAFATPLGEVAVDEPLARAILAKTGLLEADPAPHVPEHSLEVQLPFLQRTLREFAIVPILLGNAPDGTCHAIGEAVAQALKETGREKSAVIVASSDMSHYPSWANANMTDTAALKELEKFDPITLRTVISRLMASRVPNLDCVFCGEEAVYTVMYAARALGAEKAQVLHYANSGEASGDHSRVVGYGAAVFIREGSGKGYPETHQHGEKKMKEFSVSEKNRKELLRVARSSIESHLGGGRAPRMNAADAELNAPAAIFVTLTINGGLRGCIGTTVPQEPLYQAVSHMAVAAAAEDYRFPPLTSEELKRARIEISVLSPMQRVKSADEIRQNVHGVLVRRGGRSGLFLPQVWEHFSRKDDFLNELCWQKAGLEPGAWKDSATELYVFTVFAFEEGR